MKREDVLDDIMRTCKKVKGCYSTCPFKRMYGVLGCTDAYDELESPQFESLAREVITHQRKILRRRRLLNVAFWTTVVLFTAGLTIADYFLGVGATVGAMLTVVYTFVITYIFKKKEEVK